MPKTEDLEALKGPVSSLPGPPAFPNREEERLIAQRVSGGVFPEKAVESPHKLSGIPLGNGLFAHEDDAPVGQSALVPLEKEATVIGDVVRDQRPPSRGRRAELLRVSRSPSAKVLRCDDIMAPFPQLPRHRRVDLLVQEESHPGSGRIGAD